MSAETELTRRAFVRAGGAAGAGLVLAFHLPSVGRLSAAEMGEPRAPLLPFVPNAFLRIDADGTTTVVVGQSEMGQGVFTSLPMILAEELDADWTRIRVESAPATAVAGAPFGNTMMGKTQMTVGSSSVRGFWLPLRTAGATARAMLVSAAAAHWRPLQAPLPQAQRASPARQVPATLRQARAQLPRAARPSPVART